MAKRMSKPKSRLEMRREHEAAEKMGVDAEAGKAGADGVVKKKATRKKASADGTAPKKKATGVKKKSKKSEIVRLRLSWGIFDNSNQQVAIFPYAQRAAADAKLTELQEKGRSTYFMNPVREPIVEVEKTEV